MKKLAYGYICVLILKNVISQPIETQTGSQSKNEEARDPSLQRQVTITAGFTNFIEWLLYLLFGWQPTLVGTQSRPLIQWVLEEGNGGVSAVTRKVIKPANTGSEQSPAFVKEPSHYLSPNVVKEKMATAAQIMQNVRNSQEKRVV